MAKTAQEICEEIQDQCQNGASVSDIMYLIDKATRPNQEGLAEAVELFNDIGNDLIKCVPILQEHGLTNTAVETLKTIEQIQSFLSKCQGGS